ncbi:MAG: creatininase family protein [Chloroflexota bacterium]
MLHRFGELTYLEIKERAEAGWLAVIPTGCTEQQGPHLTVDFDTWVVEAILVAAAEYAAKAYAINALILPAMPFGPTPEHINFGSGYIDIPVELHNQLIASILTSLVTQRFQKLVVWRGCGGHDLAQVVDDFNQNYKPSAQAFLPGIPFYELWCRMGYEHIPGGHADTFATSLAMYLRPDSVRAELIKDPQNDPVDWADPELDFVKVTKTGVIGDPTHSSVELGKQIWPEVVKTVAKILVDCVRDSNESY